MKFMAIVFIVYFSPWANAQTGEVFSSQSEPLAAPSAEVATGTQRVTIPVENAYYPSDIGICSLTDKTIELPYTRCQQFKSYDRQVKKRKWWFDKTWDDPSKENATYSFESSKFKTFRYTGSEPEASKFLEDLNDQVAKAKAHADRLRKHAENLSSLPPLRHGKGLDELGLGLMRASEASAKRDAWKDYHDAQQEFYRLEDSQHLQQRYLHKDLARFASERLDGIGACEKLRSELLRQQKAPEAQQYKDRCP